MAIEFVTVKPKISGSTVRNPATSHRIPDSGIKVQLNAYWSRRLRDGDVELVKPSAPAPAAPSTQAPGSPKE